MNSKKLLCGAAMAASLLFFSCELPSENAMLTESFSITGMLHTGISDHQIIRVFKTSPFGDKVIMDNYISDASVYLTDSLGYSAKYVLMDDLSYGKVHRSPSKTELIPGRKYYLNVETPSGNAMGETIFPGDFKIVSHKDGDTIRVPEEETKYLELRWTKSNGSFGYVVYVDYRRIIERSDGTKADYDGANVYSSEDSCLAVPVYKSGYGIGKLIQSELHITISAYDRNFRAHHYDSQNSAGLKGSYGYIGSAVVRTIKLIIK